MKIISKFILLFVIGITDSTVEKVMANRNTMDIHIENEGVPTSEYFFNDIRQELENNNLRAGGITAIINDYADKMFANIKKFMIRSGLDPIELPEQELKLIPTGTVSLSKGWLEDTSSIARNNDVAVSYSSSTKKITFVIPIKFDTLMFIYKYNTKVLLLNLHGDAQGKVTKVKANINISFDFEKYEATLDNFDIKDTGGISLTFTGNGLLDWITNTMTTVISIFLHPVIIRIIESIVKGGIVAAVDGVNEAMSHILHNTTSVVDNNIYFM